MLLLLAVGAALVPAPAALAAAQPLPAGGAQAAPAAAQFFNSVDDLLVARAGDGRLFFYIGHLGTIHGGPFPYWGWQEIPGGGRTPYAPALVRHGDRMYAAIVGYDQRLYVQSIGANALWAAGWQEPPGGGRFSAGPALADYYGTLSVVAPGLDGQVFAQTYRAGWAGSWLLTPGGLRTSTAVGAATFAGGLIVVARGADDHRIYVQAFNGFTGWEAGWRELPGGGLTYHAPALAPAGNNRLYVLVRGIADGIAYQVADDVLTWHVGWRTLPGGGKTPYGPAVTRHGSGLHAYVTGHGHAVHSLGLSAPYPHDNLVYDPTLKYQGWQVVPGTTPAPVPAPAPPPPPPPPAEAEYSYCVRWASLGQKQTYVRWATSQFAGREALIKELTDSGNYGFLVDYGACSWA